MSLRISSAALGGVVLAAGCAPAAPPPPGEAIACALGRTAAFAKACTLEREDTAGRFVLHHPGGGFRRFTRDPQTGEVMTADGAERVSDQASAGEYLAFALGENRYRVPLRLLEGAS
jgi:hypothetical protein